MTKEERGTKQTCPSCNSKFYDLNRESIPCPVCGVMFVSTQTEEAADPLLEAEKREQEAKPKPKPKPVAPVVASGDSSDGDDETEVVEVAAELADLEDDDEVAAEGGDDTFLEDEDEGSDDVSSIIVPGVESDNDEE